MIYSITASKDATIYEGTGASTDLSTQFMNTGGDEISERGKIISSSQTVNTYNSRMLLYFPIDWSVIGTASIWTTASDASFLNMRAAAGAAIPRSHSLSIHPLSQVWDVGVGRKGNRPKTSDGVSWTNYAGESSAGQAWLTSSYPTGITGSNGVTRDGGGTWHTSSVSTYEYNMDTNPNESLDMRVDVNNILSDWSSSVITNKGFIVKLSSSFDGAENLESNKYQYGTIKYFSRNTHTIYPPKLEICWNDRIYTTGSLEVLNMSDHEGVFFYIKNNRGSYKRGSKIRLYTPGREKYPVKTFGTTSAELAIKHISTEEEICYSIIDLKTNEVIIPHDSKYTQLSCHTTLGNYFEIYADSLFEERDYRVRLRHAPDRENDNSDYSYYDIKDTFKVVR